jgi:cytochrome c biogenesis protein CcmG/thiol:disulfide interchange protein DsbE
MAQAWRWNDRASATVGGTTGGFGHNANVMIRIDTGWLHPILRICVLAALVSGAPAWAVEAGDKAPALSLPTAKGDTVALEQLRGKVVYVDFWASWCGPCRRSFPFMNEMQAKYGPRGFTVVGVNVDKKRADADRFLAQVPATFTIVFDETGATPSAWAVKGMPSSYLVDGAGKVVFVERGFTDEHKAALEQRIAALVSAGKN